MPAWIHSDPQADDGYWRDAAAYDLDSWCQGRCMNAARRRIRDYETDLGLHKTLLDGWRALKGTGGLGGGEEPQPPAYPKVLEVLGNPVVCQMCAYEVKGRLAKLDGIACVYAREADGMRGEDGEAKVSGTRSGKSVSPTVEDLDELDEWLRSWKSLYLGIDTLSRQGTLTDSITLGTAWLVAKAERILAHRDLASDFSREVHGWYGRLDRFDPSDIAVRRMPLRCPSCRQLSLERRSGESVVRCRKRDCSQGSITMDEYLGMAEREARAS